jgi:hypothetical protein
VGPRKRLGVRARIEYKREILNYGVRLAGLEIRPERIDLTVALQSLGDNAGSGGFMRSLRLGKFRPSERFVLGMFRLCVVPRARGRGDTPLMLRLGTGG